MNSTQRISNRCTEIDKYVLAAMVFIREFFEQLLCIFGKDGALPHDYFKDTLYYVTDERPDASSHACRVGIRIAPHCSINHVIGG